MLCAQDVRVTVGITSGLDSCPGGGCRAGPPMDLLSPVLLWTSFLVSCTSGPLPVKQESRKGVGRTGLWYLKYVEQWQSRKVSVIFLFSSYFSLPLLIDLYFYVVPLSLLVCNAQWLRSSTRSTRVDTCTSYILILFILLPPPPSFSRSCFHLQKVYPPVSYGL